MAFDWTRIEGYREDMSAEEKLALLDNQEQPAPIEEPAPSPAPHPTEKTVSKKLYDETASELAKVKKQLRSKMTEEEQREADRAANDEAVRLELEQLRKEKTLSTFRAAYLAQGYDERLADEAATALTDGDMDAVFAAMRKQAVNAEKALRAQILKETPVPPAGKEPSEAQVKAAEAKLRASFGLGPK